MRKVIAAVFVGIIMVAGINMSASAAGDTRNDRLKERVSVLKERVQTLKTKRNSLREDNASLRRQLAAERSPSNNQCSITSRCLPTEYTYRPWGSPDAVEVYRVRFVETIGADTYRWFAGPFWTESAAIKASERIASSSGVPGPVTVEAGTASGWQPFAE